MFLNKKNLAAIGQTKASLPSEKSFTFPERIIQFGTGVLLRGLPDHIIHQANQDGSYDGRIVVVQSTGTAAVAEFAKQDNLYTLCVKGFAGWTGSGTVRVNQCDISCMCCIYPMAGDSCLSGKS